MSPQICKRIYLESTAIETRPFRQLQGPINDRRSFHKIRNFTRHPSVVFSLPDYVTGVQYERLARGKGEADWVPNAVKTRLSRAIEDDVEPVTFAQIRGG